MSHNSTRRRFLRSTGAAALASVVGIPASAVGATVSGWTRAESPATKRLHGVCESQAGHYAVGGDGLLLHRTLGGDWQVVLQEGPTGNGQNLRAIDRTDGGERVWFAGASGVIGEYDVVTDTLYDHSSPQDITDTWEGIAVQGYAGQNEHVYLVNGSGAQLTGVRTDDGMEWRDLKKPGSGSSIPSIDCYEKRSGHLCSTNQSVFHTEDAGRTWSKVGIENQDENFYEVQSVASDDVSVCGGGGKVFWYDGRDWQEFDVADHALRGLDRDATFGLASDAAGYTYERTGVGVWERMDTPTDEALFGIVRSTTGPDVAVGDGGVIVERPD